jgi:CheY-like chemotaxis protein
MTRNFGMIPSVTSSADEAWNALQHAHQTGAPYQLLLSDVNMPDADGLTLAQWVRDDPHLKDLSVILLTSGARPEDVMRSRELNVAARLMKPIKQLELYHAIMKALGVASKAEVVDGSTSAETEWAGPPLRILLAEDSLVNQKLAIGLLSKRGHTVVVANNGQEAVAALAEQDFDVVLMDVEMPEMDGMEATTIIRERERGSGKRTPIIAMTAHAMKGDRERCLAAGMDDYVAKPVRSRSLFATLAAVMNRSGDASNSQA